MYYTVLTILVICFLVLLGLAAFVSTRERPSKEFPNCMRCGWSTYATALLLLTVSIGLLYILPTSGQNECRQDDQRWIVAILSAVFGAGGLATLSSAYYYRIHWNNTTISYRSFWGRKCTAQFEDFVGWGSDTWFEISYIHFQNAPKLYVVSEMGGLQNTEEFYKKILEIQKLKNPTLFYELAFREEVADSKECGCLACLAIFPATAITNWRYFLANQEDEDDLAICPACDHEETVLCDMGEVKITLAGLRKLNTELEADLSEKERLARQKRPRSCTE